jgi:D-amino-acid dehydrogenase
MWPLVKTAVEDPRFLAQRAGVSDLIRPGGWIEVFHKQEAFQKAVKGSNELKERFGVEFEALEMIRKVAMISVRRADNLGPLHL